MHLAPEKNANADNVRVAENRPGINTDSARVANNIRNIETINNSGPVNNYVVPNINNNMGVNAKSDREIKIENAKELKRNIIRKPNQLGKY